MRWHCFTGAYESVYEFTAEADTPQKAAELAATRHGIAGEWTVVPGEPVKVTVREVTAYSAGDGDVCSACGAPVKFVPSPPDLPPGRWHHVSGPAAGSCRAGEIVPAGAP